LGAQDAIPALLVAVSSGIVLSIAVLLIIYKMIDGDVHVGVGFPAIVVIMALLLMSVKPPFPAMPGIVLVVALTLMAFFPFALNTIERFELQAIDTDRMERAYRSLAEKPDNLAALFELSRCLHQHGMASHAIAITSATLEGLSRQIDPVRNASLRDAFRGEDYMLKSWIRERDQKGATNDPVKCPSCGSVNAIGQPVCLSCKRPYLLDLARQQDIRPKILSRLVLAWAVLAGFLVGTVSLGMNFQGPTMVVMFSGALAGVAFFLNWLFKKPKLAT
jgi:hypothetical protein